MSYLYFRRLIIYRIICCCNKSARFDPINMGFPTPWPHFTPAWWRNTIFDPTIWPHEYRIFMKYEILCFPIFQKVKSVKKPLFIRVLSTFKHEKGFLSETLIFHMVEHRGLEPLTSWLPVMRAPSCANAPDGATGRDRTGHLHVTNVLLCQMSYSGSYLR